MQKEGRSAEEVGDQEKSGVARQDRGAPKRRGGRKKRREEDGHEMHYEMGINTKVVSCNKLIVDLEKMEINTKKHR